MRARLLLAAAFVMILAAAASAHWDESMSAKWVQMPDLDPTGMDVNCTHQDPNHFILADDFPCTETGLITGIHIWGSWYADSPPFGDPYAVAFTLSIHEDIPADASPTGYSMPGEVLWILDFGPDDFHCEQWATDLLEGWYDPGMVYLPDGDTICWLYNFSIPESLAFLQEGTPEESKVYWLDLHAYPSEEFTFFGWKTSLDHWNDDGVYGLGSEPYYGPWYELIYPQGHPMMEESIDLAFVIEGEPLPGEEDWGDAPDPTYPTLAVNGGASHTIVPGLQLGWSVDAEPDGQPDPQAYGDDLNGVADEDGIMWFSPFVPGAPAALQVDLTFSTGGVLDAWIDFDGNGTWDVPSDVIFSGQALPGGTVTMLGFNVPSWAVPGQTFARFRFSSAGVAGPTGPAPDGEVEDYVLHIGVPGEEWKWTQMPDINDTGIDIDGSADFILADDYLCTAPGRVTRVFVWSSWKDDCLPFQDDPFGVDFTLSIHADIPADTAAGQHSRPGDLLWFRDFHYPEFDAWMWEWPVSEGWMTPPGQYYAPSDTVCWIYRFDIPEEEAFHQVGMPDEPVVYWLDVQARPADPLARWGWKTSVNHWNDDAVWGEGLEPYFEPWSELRYPIGHPYAGESLDLAFDIQMWYGTDVPDGDAQERHGLRQNVPNPFNPETTIRYEVPAGGGHVEVQIVDVSGRLVRTLVDGSQTEGPKSIDWDGRDDAGRQVATGVYFYRLVAPGIEESKKMLLLK